MKVTFLEVVEATGAYKKVTCRVEDGSSVNYQVINDELCVNRIPHDYRDFCFSPSQVLYGTWTVEESLPKATESNEPLSHGVTEAEAFGNDCKNGQCS